MTILWPSAEPCARESAMSLVASAEWNSTIALWPRCGSDPVFWDVYFHDLGQWKLKDLSASTAKGVGLSP